MPGPSRKVDFNELVHNPRTKVKFEVESLEEPEELQSRLSREEADAALLRWKDFLLFLAAIIGVGGVVVLCAVLAVRPAASPDDKKWATALLASIVSAAVGFLAGKGSK